MSEQRYYEGVGRRKTSTARVRIYPGGSGSFIVNDKPANEFFSRVGDLEAAYKALELLGVGPQFDVTVHVRGGGVTGQVGAVRMGLARAMTLYDEELRSTMRRAGLLSRDPREKERKKPGLKRARKAPTYTKR